MGGGKHNKGCCGGCASYCFENGGSDCSIPSSQSYGFAPAPGTTFHGSGYSCCEGILDGALGGDPMVVVECGTVMNNTFETGDCEWVSDECIECDAISTLVISAGPVGVLTVVIGAYTYVYKSVAGYNPLCVSLFVYSPADSTPSEECGWPDKLCMFPFNFCCPDYAFPDTLEAMFEAVIFGCPCSEDDPANKTLTRVTVNAAPSAPYLYTVGAHARWVGVIDVGSCGHSLYVTLECVSDPGLGTRMKVQFAAVDGEPCVPDTSWTTKDDYDVSCDPFILTFELDGADDCCDVPFSHLLKIIFFDPS